MKGFEFDPLSLYGIKPIDTSLPTTMVQQSYNMKLLYTKAEVDAKIAAAGGGGGGAVSSVNGYTGTVVLAKGDVGLGNVDNTSDSTKNSASATLANKRIQKRVTSITSSATPTINTDDCDAVNITALAAAITSMTANLSGAPNDFDTLIFRIKDNGTARAITWGASFLAGGVALPTTTVISKVLTVGFIYDTVKTAWSCIASAQEV